MGDRDPFGREQGEDSLAGMGWRVPEPVPAGADATPAAAVETAPPEPEPAPADPRAWVPLPRRPRRWSGWRVSSLLIRLAIVAAVIFAIATAAVRVGGEIEGAIDAIEPAQIAPEAPIPRGLDRESFLRPENFRTALARMRDQGRVQSIRVSPDRLTARLVSTQRRVVWNLRVGTDPQRVVAPPYDDFNTTIAFSQVDPDAPQRFARAAARRAHRSVDDVDFLFLQRNVGRPRWVLYFEGGLHYTADRHGRHVERG